MQNLPQITPDAMGDAPATTPVFSDSLTPLTLRETRRVASAKALIRQGVFDGASYVDEVAAGIIDGQIGSTADAERRGRRAAEAGHPFQSNPYGPDCEDLRLAWEDGFLDFSHEYLSEA